MADTSIEIIVDGITIEATEGESLLRVCLDNDIYIPNLCYLEGMERPPASCRLCFVEIDGENRPVSSCTIKVSEGMVVKTDTPEIRELQRSNLQLLLSVHNVDCGNCPANKKCVLQNLARFLKTGLKPRKLDTLLKEIEIDETNPFLNYYPNRCVLCGRCVYVCRINNDRQYLTFAKRGLDTIISSDSESDISGMPCENCHLCVEVCPVSAITLRTQ